MARNFKMPTHAMVLAAGLGRRMRPVTLTTPKPLVRIQGHTLLDRVLDMLEKVKIERVVVNVHHLADQIVDHLAGQHQQRPFEIILSDERTQLLDSAGGVIKALPHLGKDPFFILNADSFWHEEDNSQLERLANGFNIRDMDMLLLTVRREQAAFPERGDFLSDIQGCLRRAAPNMQEAVIYGGALVVNPAIFYQIPVHCHSLNHYFDRAIMAKRLFGLPLEGRWYTLTTAQSIPILEQILLEKP